MKNAHLGAGLAALVLTVGLAACGAHAVNPSAAAATDPPTTSTPTQNYLDALSAAGIDTTDSGWADSDIRTGKESCSEIKQGDSPNDAADFLYRVNSASMTRDQANAQVVAAMKYLCPEVIHK